MYNTGVPCPHVAFSPLTLSPPPSLPLALHPSRKQAHAADVAIQAITSLQRDRHNLEVQLQSATGKAANERLQQTLNAVQVRFVGVGCAAQCVGRARRAAGRGVGAALRVERCPALETICPR